MRKLRDRRRGRFFVAGEAARPGEGVARRIPSSAHGALPALDRLAARIAGLTGWRRNALAFAAGGVSALAQAPFGYSAALLISLTLLVFLLDGAAMRPTGRRLRTAALVGWWWGFGAFLAGLWWIGAAFLVDAADYGWMIPFAVAGLPAGLAMFPMAAAVLTIAFWRPGASRVLALAAALTATEWLRGRIATGFPWNDIGYALTNSEALMQGASLIGVSGLALVAALAGAAPAAPFGPFGRRRSGTALCAAAAALIGALAAFGFARLSGADDADVAGVRLHLVQPAIDQSEKWRPENRWQSFDVLLSLTREAQPAPEGGTTVVVWPETSTPFLLADSAIALGDIARSLPERSVLVAGTVFATAAETGGDSEGDSAETAASERYYNSALAIDRTGTIIGRDDKVHLVPFGEYLPFQSVLEGTGLGALAESLPGGFTPGSGHMPMTLPGVPPASVLICYEAIFPAEVVTPGTHPGWLLNLTNDAWFGDTPGPYQHFQQARVRAVEQGLPLVRAANTGISAIVDPYGRVRASLALSKRGVVDGTLPAAIGKPLYARIGDAPVLGVVAVVFLLLAARRRGRQHKATD